jgi:TonB-dependent receptor-like protein/carboxypeptidase family protein
MGHPGRFRRKFFAIATIACAIAATHGPANAQSISLQLVDAPLTEGLAILTSQAGVDVVFAERLVREVRTSCAYRGEDPGEALRCLLRNTGLRARSTGLRQYVLLARGARVSVSGFITDGESGRPLPGAHVLLVALGRGAIANRTGYFLFPAETARPYRVQVSYVGYALLDTVVVATRRPVSFELQPTAISGGAVLVESMEPRPGEHQGMPGMAAPPMSRLERLPAALGGRDLIEALTWLPGIRRAGEVTGGLIIRGAGPDQNLYLLDGAPVYHPWHAFSLISTFQTETFRSVRLYRGATPAEFGGRLSGVLDAELSDGRGAEPAARAAVNVHSARFLIETPITPRSSFMLGGRRSYVDRIIGRSHPVSDEFGRRDTLRTGYYFYDWTAKLVFRPDQKSRLSITSYTGLDDLDLRLPFDLSLDLSSWLKPADLLFEIAESWRNQVVSARYERLLSQHWYLTSTVYDSRYEASEGAFLRPTLTASVRSAYQVEVRDLGLRMDMDYFRSAESQVRLGAQVVDRTFGSEVDALIQYNPGLSERLKQQSNSKAIEFSAYAQDTWRPSAALQIITGLRVAAFGSDRLVRLEPRFSMQWAAHPRLLILRASATRNYQYLHRIRDRNSYLYDMVSSRWIPSGGQTAPAKGTEYSVGIESHFVPKLELRGDIYLRRQEHILLPRDQAQSKDRLAGPGIELGTLLGQYVAGQGRASGIELSANLETRSIFGSFALTAERSRTRAPELGETEFRPSRFDVPLALRSFVEYRTGSWSLAAGATVRSGYPITVPEASYEITGPVSTDPVTYLYRPAPHNGRLPTYQRVDVSASRSFQWMDGQWRFQLQLYNVLNYRNVINRFFEPRDGSVITTNRRGLPILPLFELEVVL